MDEGKAVNVVYLDFSKDFDTVFSQHSPGEAGGSWQRQVYSLLSKTLAGWPSAESGGEQS